MKLAMIFPGQGSQSVGMMRAYAGLPEIGTVAGVPVRRVRYAGEAQEVLAYRGEMHSWPGGPYAEVFTRLA